MRRYSCFTACIYSLLGNEDDTDPSNPDAERLNCGGVVAVADKVRKVARVNTPCAFPPSIYSRIVWGNTTTHPPRGHHDMVSAIIMLHGFATGVATRSPPSFGISSLVSPSFWINLTVSLLLRHGFLNAVSSCIDHLSLRPRKSIALRCVSETF